MLPELVSTSDLCLLFNVQRSTVPRWVKSGLLARRSHGRFDLVSTVRAYGKLIEHRKADAIAGAMGEETVVAKVGAQRARLLQLQADRLTQEFAVASGKLIDEDEVSATWAECSTLVRSAVMGVSPRFASALPHQTRHDVAVLDQMLRDALTGLRRP
jgi:phage terminase Nu1 subunit (DNA packaging protein)